jgi:hypothetical protein
MGELLNARRNEKGDTDRALFLAIDDIDSPLPRRSAGLLAPTFISDRVDHQRLTQRILGLGSPKFHANLQVTTKCSK